MKKTTITFYNGVREVTGSNFVLEHGDERVMVDCGLVQGIESDEGDPNRAPFPYKPADISALVVTHAHLDHIGRIPKLVADGFAGTIYSTPETKALAELVFDDALGIMDYERREKGAEPLYDAKSVKRALAHWKTVGYHRRFDPARGFAATLLDAGHILGSAVVMFTVAGKTIAFSGDLGNSPAPLLRDTEFPRGAEYLVVESVYGDRTHEDAKKRSMMLEDIIERTIRERGALLIPAFSIERTQALLADINALVESRRVPPIPVFLDSPLAIKVTELYRKSALHFNKKTKHIIASGDDIFQFPGLSFTRSSRDSREIDDTPGPKIILAGSGMSEGGRIVRHEKRYLPDAANTLLIVGYQAAGTRGRALVEGATEVEIDGARVPVRARVKTIYSYSDHRDTDGLLEFVAGGGHSLKTVFIAMGETASSSFLAQRIRDYLGVTAVVPEKGQTAVLD